ncbi:MAG: hypothetical protein CSA47_01260 [Gammaproteobacteria bacterium]|nr:MAG: hypothetical protein CSA47_01260 [Gammaproteobacteria bacterium]
MNIVKSVLIAAILSLATVMPSAYAVKDGETFKSWKGHCEKFQGKEFCGISQTVVDADKKPVVNIFIRKVKVKDKPNHIAFIKVPLGVNLQAGLGLAVDKKEIARVPYTVCDPAGCNAILPLKEELINKIKTGGKMQIGVLLVNKEIVLTASLSGVTKALEAL